MIVTGTSRNDNAEAGEFQRLLQLKEQARRPRSAAPEPGRAGGCAGVPLTGDFLWTPTWLTVTSPLSGEIRKFLQIHLWRLKKLWIVKFLSSLPANFSSYLVISSMSFPGSLLVFKIQSWEFSSPSTAPPSRRKPGPVWCQPR